MNFISERYHESASLHWSSTAGRPLSAIASRDLSYSPSLNPLAAAGRSVALTATSGCWFMSQEFARGWRNSAAAAPSPYWRRARACQQTASSSALNTPPRWRRKLRCAGPRSSPSHWPALLLSMSRDCRCRKKWTMNCSWKR